MSADAAGAHERATQTQEPCVRARFDSYWCTTHSADFPDGARVCCAIEGVPLTCEGYLPDLPPDIEAD